MTLIHLERQHLLFVQSNDIKARLRCLSRIGTIQLAIGTFKAAVQTFKMLVKLSVNVGSADTLKEATEKLEEAKAQLAAGKAISAAEAAAALGMALDKDDIGQRAVNKWTVRGTMSRVFGKR